MRGQMTHLDSDVLAEFRAGLITGRRGVTIAAHLAGCDRCASTFRHTSYYDGNPVFGGLKKGTGLLLDMGRAVRLSQVAVQFGTTCCNHVQIEIGNETTPSPRP